MVEITFKFQQTRFLHTQLCVSRLYSYYRSKDRGRGRVLLSVLWKLSSGAGLMVGGGNVSTGSYTQNVQPRLQGTWLSEHPALSWDWGHLSGSV